MHPRLSRVLYRSFLRASNGGQHPEVFGRHGAAVFAQQSRVHDEHASLALPVNAHQVQKRLKEWFRRPLQSLTDDCLTDSLCRDTKSNPLDILRQVYQNTTMLSSSSPPSVIQRHLKYSSIPIFDYDLLAALPGEQFQTLFLEPRYTQGLLPMLLDSTSPQLFLLRPHQHASQSTLVKLLSHQHVILPACTVGMRDLDSELLKEPKRMISGVAVTCVAGPRVTISKEKVLSVDTIARDDDYKNNPGESKCWSRSDAPLGLAVETQLVVDHQGAASSNSMKFFATRQYILNLVECILSFHDSDLGSVLVQTGFGLPPLDPEAFSFWALRFVLRKDDMEGRHFWLHNCHSTAERLQNAIIQMEAIVDAQTEHDKEERVAMARFG